MIRVMIVEDEPPIANSIRILAEEYSDRIQVVHTAINGQRALEYLERQPVDLIFSDIKMPIMDGLGLAKEVRERYPGTTMVIISGFQEFEFARSALHYGVSNYLLKPVSRKNLYEVLDDVCSKIKQKRSDATRRMVERAIRNESTAELGQAPEQCGVLLICAGAYPLTPDELVLTSRNVWDNTDIEGYLREFLSPRETCICLHGKSLSERAVVFSARDNHRVLEVGQALFKYLKRSCSCAVTVVAAQRPISLGEVGDTFNRLRRRLYREIRLFHSCFLPLEQGEEAERAGAEPSSMIRGVVLALKTADIRQIRPALEQMVQALAAQKIRQTELVIYLEKLVISSFGRTHSPQQIGEIQFEIHGAISTSPTAEDLAAELAQVFFSWVRSDSVPEKGQEEELCESVAEYIHLHYRDNITSSALSRQFGYSSTRLAKRFREYFGMSISEYVNKYRVELAQAMMRNNRKLMIKEIALEVGYNDQYYFSKTFKKITGVWPTEYLQEEQVTPQP